MAKKKEEKFEYMPKEKMLAELFKPQIVEYERQIMIRNFAIIVLSIAVAFLISVWLFKIFTGHL